MFLGVFGRDILRPKPVHRKDRHAHQDQRQGLGKGICAGKSQARGKRGAQEIDQPPQHNFDADQGHKIEVKTAYAAHVISPEVA